MAKYKGYVPGLVSSGYTQFVKLAEKKDKEREKRNLMRSQAINNITKAAFTGIKARDTKIRADLKESKVFSTKFNYQGKDYNIYSQNKSKGWGGIIGSNLKNIDARVDYDEGFAELIDSDPAAYQEYLKQIQTGGELQDFNANMIDLGIIETSIPGDPNAYKKLIKKYGQEEVDKIVGDKNEFMETYKGASWNKVEEKLDRRLNRKNQKGKTVTEETLDQQGTDLAELNNQFIDLTSLAKLDDPSPELLLDYSNDAIEDFSSETNYVSTLDGSEKVTPGAQNTLGNISEGAYAAVTDSMDQYYEGYGSGEVIQEIEGMSTPDTYASDEFNLFGSLDMILNPGMNYWDNAFGNMFDSADDVTIDSDINVT
tara:strand:+ start:5978 stop:7084 length:1107 start_codon:yes stop_codon:yes gene_type:complete